MQSQLNMLSLPLLAFTQILSNLHLKDILSLSETCKYLRAITNDSYLWNLLINRQWPIESQIPKPDILGYALRKSYFKRKYIIDRNWSKSKYRQVVFAGHDDQVLGVAIDGDIAVTSSNDRSLGVWDIRPESDHESFLTLTGHTGNIQCLKFRNTTIVSGGNDKTVRVWEIARDLSQASCRQVLTDLKREIWGVQFNDERIVASGAKGEICLWDSKDYRLIKRMEFHGRGIRREALILTDDHYVICGSLDSTITVWDSRNGELIRTLSGHTKAIYSLQYDSIRKRLISSSEDADIRIWDIETGECVQILSGHTKLVARLRYRQIDGILASASDDCTVKVWNTFTGECLNTFGGFKGRAVVYGIELLENRVVGGGSIEDPTIRVWDIRTGETQCVLEGHNGTVFDLRCDESRIISAGADGTVRMWDFGLSSAN